MGVLLDNKENQFFFPLMWKGVIMDRIITFSVPDLKKLGAEAVSIKEIWEETKKAVKFLFEVQMLRKSRMLLGKDTMDQADKTLEEMRKLKEKYPQVHGIVQKIVGQEIADRAKDKGDSRTLFSRLEFLVEQGVFFGSIAEWSEADLMKVPFGLKKDFEIRVYNPRTKQVRHFLPASWRNDTHKRTALVLRDLSFKARDTYKAERESQKSETPAEKSVEVKVETKINDFVPPQKTEPKIQKSMTTKKSNKKDDDPKVGKKAKAVKDKDREKQDEIDLKSVKSFADIGKLVQ